MKKLKLEKQSAGGAEKSPGREREEQCVNKITNVVMNWTSLAGADWSECTICQQSGNLWIIADERFLRDSEMISHNQSAGFSGGKVHNDKDL